MAQSKESQIEMFGCEIEPFMESVDRSGSTYLQAAMSILSNAQHELDYHEGGEVARKAINRAKYLISMSMDKEREWEERKFNEEKAKAD